MKKREYTHVQMLLPEIEGMILAGKTQRAVAEQFEFNDKYVVKRLLKREREKRRKLAAGAVPQAKGRPLKSRPQFIWITKHKSLAPMLLIINTA